jgi:ribonuclease HI
MAKKRKLYVVWEGNNPGIYDSWADCQLQIKAYPGAKYKSFETVAEAQEAYRAGYQKYINFNKFGKKKAASPMSAASRAEIVWDSISVDAACSGNPGVMEYQGVDTKTKFQFFHQKFPLGTNNIGEFLAIVHALAMFQRDGSTTPIYTDSKIAMGWVQRRQCKTKLIRNAKTEHLHQLIERAENWLKANHYPNKIMKWDTKNWGEIPADFGRK